jgi:hypothetical protein
MTPQQFHLLILAGVASKMVWALVFLHWIETRAEKTRAQAVRYIKTPTSDERKVR